jgi:tetratricopeptide (TPR) repeat protein
MNSGQDFQSDKQKSSRPKRFLTVAFIFFALMGILWSLDGFFVYVTFGAGIYFLFLAFWSLPKLTGFSQSYRASQGEDILKEIFREKKNTGKSAPFSRPHSGKSDPAVVRLASMFIFFVFFVIVLFVIVLPEGDDMGSTSSYDRAEQFRYNGDYDSAKYFYRKALSENPEDAKSLFGYGNVFQSEEKYDSALSYFDRVIALDPEYNDARYNRALVRYSQRNYNQSLREAREILALDPDYHDATLIIGDSYYSQNKTDSAIYWYERGYASGLRSAALCHVMAYLYDIKNNTARAIPMYQETLSYDSSKVEIYSRLAELIPSEQEKYRALANRYK